MDEHDEALLAKYGLNASDAVRTIWMSLPLEDRGYLNNGFSALHLKSLLNEKVALMLSKSPGYSLSVAKLLFILHDKGIDYNGHLDLIGSNAYVAHRIKAILDHLSRLGFDMNLSRLVNLLSMRDGGELDYLIELLHPYGLLNEARLDAILNNNELPVMAYADCIKLLIKNHLFTDSNESRLLSLPREYFLGIMKDLFELGHGCMLSQELFDALVNLRDDFDAIFAGLAVLRSRIEPNYTPAQAMTVISARRRAESVAVSLSFLVKSGLDSSENRDALLVTKEYAEPVAIILYQLTCNSTHLTQDEFNRTIAVAPLLMEPVLMEKLKRIEWISPLTKPRINALLSKLSTATTGTSEADKVELLATCATIIDPASARGGDISGAASAPQARMSPV